MLYVFKDELNKVNHLANLNMNIGFNSRSIIRMMHIGKPLNTNYTKHL